MKVTNLGKGVKIVSENICVSVGEGHDGVTIAVSPLSFGEIKDDIFNQKFLYSDAVEREQSIRGEIVRHFSEHVDDALDGSRGESSRVALYFIYRTLRLVDGLDEWEGAKSYLRIHHPYYHVGESMLNTIERDNR